MKLSTRSRYGLRMMINLAELYGTGPVDLKYISSRENISLKYLGQISLSLKAAGLTQTRRGVNGGHMLSKKPDHYTLLEIIEAIEGRINIVDCLDEAQGCEREETCSARNIWAELNETIRKNLESMRLSDLLLKHNSLRLKQVKNKKKF